jgi:hypothetical protein
MLSILMFALLAARTGLAPLEFAHTPEWLYASSKPETKLMGIRVEGQSVGEAKKRFGRPSGVERDPDYPNQGTYHWQLGTLALSVTTTFPIGTTDASGEHIYSVTVQGPASNAKAKTSAGVGLGDTLDTLIAKYGTKYQTGFRKELSEHLTIVFVFSDGTELAAGLDEDGRIQALQLTASIE